MLTHPNVSYLMRSIHPRRVLTFLAFALLLPVGLTAASLEDFPPFSKKEYTPAGLGPKEPDPEVNFPGSATARKLTKGSAVVSILVNAEGQAEEMLVVKCTDHVFGTALLEAAKTLKFAPARFKGSPVPARFNLAYSFAPTGKMMTLNALQAASNISAGAPQMVYGAVAENVLDRPLEFTHAAMPPLPAGHVDAGAKPVMLFVTFYVDAEGTVRAPNVESAPAPELIAPMIETVRHWTFKPPMVKGMPVLVFTGRAVGFGPAAQ